MGSQLRTFAMVAAIVIVIIALLSVWTFRGGSEASAPEPTVRTIYMAAIEPKGSTTTDLEPFPTTALPGGGGYKTVEPNDEDSWSASTYRWSPGTVVVYQGDEVTLQIFGINGALHPTTIEEYNVEFEVMRGQITEATFTADKAGIFQIICHAHQPSMTAQLIVLPR